jgi:hypothetical protein
MPAPAATIANDIVTYAGQALAYALMLFAMMAFHKAQAYLSALANGTQQSNYESALKKSLAAAFESCAGALAKYGSTHPETKDMLIQMASATLVQRFPKTAAAVGVKSADDAVTALTRLYGTLPAVPASGTGIFNNTKPANPAA